MKPLFKTKWKDVLGNVHEEECDDVVTFTIIVSNVKEHCKYHNLDLYKQAHLVLSSHTDIMSSYHIVNSELIDAIRVYVN